MAFTRWPALLGLQRSFLRILHALSWAFARSPGPRSLACGLSPLMVDTSRRGS